MKKRVYEILDIAQDGDTVSRLFDVFILSLIVVNVIMVILGTVPSIKESYSQQLYIFEVFSVVVFTLEYFSRIWSCTENPEFKGFFWGRVKYTFSFMALIDLIAILPFYLALGGLDLRLVRALRLFRIFRIAKVGRYYGSLQMIRNVFVTRTEELILSVFMMLLLLLISSSVMYFVENEVQPEAFSSIPAAMWWAVAALTTVGYGDVYPVTNLGRFMGAIIAITGIGMFALPAGIIASGFVEEIGNKRDTKNNAPDHSLAKTESLCEQCGQSILKE